MEILVDGVRYVPQIPKEENAIPFADLVGEARERKGETLIQASHGIGVHQSTLRDYEYGRAEPNLRALKRILRYYNIDFNQIL
jgi:transcriptional regulator with XRE-family HTH domain